MSETIETMEPRWYVVHTYSGYESKVRANLEKTVENRNLQDFIQEIKVPVEEVSEIKNGKRHTTLRKVFPGYVLIKMIMTDQSWYVVRNTRGVTGFVGPGSKPIPLTQAELDNMELNTQARTITIDMEVGESVLINAGALEGFTGVIEEIMENAQKVRVVVSMFGRETPVELEYGQVSKL